MPKKSIDQLKKEIKVAEKEKERRRLENKLKSLKPSSGLRKKLTPSKKTRSGIVASISRAAGNFGF